MANFTDLHDVVQVLHKPSTWLHAGTFASIYSFLKKSKEGLSIHWISEDDEPFVMAALNMPFATAYTDYESVYIFESFAKRLTPAGLLFVALHEGGHVALNHRQRLRHRNPSRWNDAADIKINEMAFCQILPSLLRWSDEQIGDPAQVFMGEPIGWGFTPETASYLKLYGAWSEEEIYNDLLRKEQQARLRFEKDNTPEEGDPSAGDGAPSGLPPSLIPPSKKKNNPSSGTPSPKDPFAEPSNDPAEEGSDGQPEAPSKDSKDTKGKGKPTPGAGQPFPEIDDPNNALDTHPDEPSIKPTADEVKKRLEAIAKDTKIQEKIESAGGIDKVLKRVLDIVNTADGDAQALPGSDTTTDEIIKKAHQLSLNARRQMSTKLSQVGAHIDQYVIDELEIDKQARKRLTWEKAAVGFLELARDGAYREIPDTMDELSDWSRIPELADAMGLPGEIQRNDLLMVGGRAHALSVIDSSGSVTDNELRQAAQEHLALLESGPTDLLMVSADTRARHRQYYSSDSLDDFPEKIEIGGGGGTDMLTPLIQEICHDEITTGLRQKFDLAIEWSDGVFDAFSRDDLEAGIRGYLSDNPARAEEIIQSEIPPIVIVVSRYSPKLRALRAAKEDFPDGTYLVFHIDEGDGMTIAVDENHQLAMY